MAAKEAAKIEIVKKQQAKIEIATKQQAKMEQVPKVDIVKKLGKRERPDTQESSVNIQITNNINELKRESQIRLI